MRRTALTALTASLTAAAALAVAAPTSAATYDHDDAVGDPYRVTVTEEEGEVWSPAPEATELDLTSVTIRHARRIRVSVTGVDFTRDSGAMIYELRAGRRQSLTITQRVGSDRDWPMLEPWGSGARACHRITGEVDRAADTAAVSVPRACLKRPDWVRASAGSLTFEESRRRLVGVVDDAQTDGQPGDDLVLSPRVWRRAPAPQ